MHMINVRNCLYKSFCFCALNRLDFGRLFSWFFGRGRTHTSTSQPTPWQSILIFDFCVLFGGAHWRAHLESGTTGSANHQQLAALCDPVWRKLRSESVLEMKFC
jgi:hypothetical protein